MRTSPPSALRLPDLTTLRQGVSLVLESGRGLAALQLLIMVLQSAIPLVALYLMKEIVDVVAAAVSGQGGNASRLTTLILLAAGVAVLGAALKSISTLVMEAQSLRLGDHVQELLHAKSVELDLEFYESAEYHDALHRAQVEAPVRPARIVNSLVQLGQSSLSLVAVIGLLVSFDWLLLVALLAAALPGLVVKTRFSTRLYAWTRQRTTIERLVRYLNHVLTSIESAKEVRIFGLGDVFRGRHRALRAQVREERLRLARARTSLDLVAQTVAIGAVFGSMLVIARRALSGAISVGDVVMYFGAFQRAQDFFRDALAALASLYESNLFLADFTRFLALAPTVVDPPRPRAFPRPIRGGISLEDVHFRYPGTDRPVLKGVTLSIRPGEHVAIVGENGSGKTTLVKLLCRLYDPTSGAVRIDGTDLRELRIADLRAAFAVVFQDYAKFNLSVRDNIWTGNVALPPESPAIVEAAERTGADEVIRGLPHGYDTMLGRQFEGGVELSVGQWQKLALARAFLRDTPFLVLDEPTAALDPRAEAAVFDHFHELAKGRTTVFISHRLSTVRHADRILVMVDGRIAESGAHEELVEQAGVYASLFETQARHYR